ncbi:EAL domain-containing protein [Cohnella sp. GCM10027633]|uniref:EAL domain-containing protein n=1 Tax=unclassified Cohnella TaxID=2636738 RepID=UPI003640975C
MDKQRVLVVDDSAVMRQLISSLLERDGRFAVVGTAVDGLEALLKVDSLRPDLVTMDIEMPGMDGLTSLRHMMDTDPIPVIVLSTYTDEGSAFAIEALELGAADFFHKDALFQHPRNPQAEEEFLLRCQAALCSRPFLRKESETAHNAKIINGLLEIIAGMLQLKMHVEAAFAQWRNAFGSKGLYLRLRADGERFVVAEGEGAMLRMFGWPEEAVAELAIEEMLPGEIAQEWTSYCDRAWRGETSVSFNGEWRSYSILTVFRPILSEGVVTEVIALSIDTTEQKRQETRISDLANLDLLTGLPNRRNLVKQLERKTLETNRFALLNVQIEQLKLANETLGQEIGDRLLQLIARRLKSSAIGEVAVFRTGGNQFVCLLPNAAREAAASFADKIMHCVRQPIRVDRHEVHLSSSIGVSLYPGDHDVAEHLIRYADIARVYAEKQGGGVLEFYHPRYQEEIQRRMAIETYLRRALERDEFVLLYQPEMDIASHRIIGFECLIRWDCPELGRVSPAEFIPVAEETGLIYRIGEWVLREACRQNRCWQDAGLPKLFVAVNLSSRQFYDQKLSEKVGAILQDTGLAPECLELEITESMTMNMDSATPTLHALRSLGLTVAVDDFGTGYSSLAYLKKLPIDKLKIDRSFVSEMTSSAVDASIVNTIIALSEDLNLCVTAEGVESEDELLLLRQLGCDIAQGYWLSKPIEAVQVPIFLNQFNGRSTASIN